MRQRAVFFYGLEPIAGICIYGGRSVAVVQPHVSRAARSLRGNRKIAIGDCENPIRIRERRTIDKRLVWQPCCLNLIRPRATWTGNGVARECQKPGRLYPAGSDVGAVVRGSRTGEQRLRLGGGGHVPLFRRRRGGARLPASVAETAALRRGLAALRGHRGHHCRRAAYRLHLRDAENRHGDGGGLRRRDSPVLDAYRLAVGAGSGDAPKTAGPLPGLRGHRAAGRLSLRRGRRDLLHRLRRGPAGGACGGVRRRSAATMPASTCADRTCWRSR